MVNLSKGIRQSNIRKTDIVRIPIPLIPPNESKLIVSRIEELFSNSDSVERSIPDTYTHMETLEKSILAKAFHGELVPQDPNDESASALLERIRKQKGIPPQSELAAPKD